MLDVKLPPKKPNRLEEGPWDSSEAVVGGALGFIGGTSEEVEYLRVRWEETLAKDAR